MIAMKSAIPPRKFSAATRLEMSAGELSPSDRRALVVEEIQELVEKTNQILEMRDGIGKRVPRRPAGLREAEFERLAELYAENMVQLEEKNGELKRLEIDMKLYGPANQ